MSTERLRFLLREVCEQELAYRICSAEDLTGPGGGVYIAAKTELEERHLDWLDRRNPAEMASFTAARTPLPHAPEARMTVVTQTPSKDF